MAVRKQHTVSATLLRRWSVDGNLSIVDVHVGTEARRGPKKVATREWFVPPDFSDPMERLWKEVEDRTPAALDDVASGQIFSRPSSLETIRDLAALHVIRARHSEILWADNLVRDATDGDLADVFEMIRDPEVLRASYFDRTGLHPVSDNQLHEESALLVEGLERRLRVGGEAFAEELTSAFERAKRDLPTVCEIGRVTEGALLISDNPVLTLDSETDRAGVLNGVSIGSADALLLPLGPGYLWAAGGSNAYVDLDAATRDNLNRLELASAIEHVFLRPDATHVDWILDELTRPSDPK